MRTARYEWVLELDRHRWPEVDDIAGLAVAGHGRHATSSAASAAAAAAAVVVVSGSAAAAAEGSDERLAAREHTCEFSAGDCWGYERLYEIGALANDVWFW
jgi:hypothetical protein